MKNNTNTEYRLYAFAHSWLSGVQKGIQTAHAVANLLRCEFKSRKDVKQWADEDQTIILLDGGNCAQLNRTLDQISDETDFSYSFFYEDEESLSSSLTSAVVVVPNWVYECTFDDYKYKLAQKYWTFFELIKSAKLAV